MTDETTLAAYSRWAERRIDWAMAFELRKPVRANGLATQVARHRTEVGIELEVKRRLRRRGITWHTGT